MKERLVELQGGELRLRLSSERLELDRLLAFATRENPQRAFLFVSKVLGRHWPCRPRQMRQTYRLLAEGLAGCPGPVLVIGMAETATGLGHGVFDSFLEHSGRADVLYIHTTRHFLDRKAAIRIEEKHSHCVDHSVYEPAGDGREIFYSARTLVLVDDEVSTGRTLAALGRACLDLNPRIERVHLATLVSWLPDLAELERAFDRPVTLGALASGTFEFSARPSFPLPSPAANRVALRRGRHVSADYGRAGFSGRFALASLPELPPRSRLVVLGTGEFAYPPFHLAERLEAAGHDVLFQASTRSPVRRGDAIGSRLVFADHHGESVANYLYNYPRDGRRAIVGYENIFQAREHCLPRLLRAAAWTPREGKIA